MSVLTPADLDRPISVGDYLDTIDPDDLGSHDFSERTIDNVYRDATKRFIHVAFRSNTPEVFLVVVIEAQTGAVYGHHLLDLRRRGRLARLINRR